MSFTRIDRGRTAVYVAGPMTGYEDFNYPAFEDATQRLREAGYDVLSPHEVHGDDLERPWAAYLRDDLALMLQQASVVALLPGWQASRGAALEAAVARTVGIPVLPFEDLLEAPAPDLHDYDELFGTVAA